MLHVYGQTVIFYFMPWFFPVDRTWRSYFCTVWERLVIQHYCLWHYKNASLLNWRTFSINLRKLYLVLWLYWGWHVFIKEFIYDTLPLGIYQILLRVRGNYQNTGMVLFWHLLLVLHRFLDYWFFFSSGRQC